MLQQFEQTMNNDNPTDSKHHWHANNTMGGNYLDYTDSLSQSFLSPMSSSLQDMDDMDYQPSPGKKKQLQSVPMFGESPSDYSLASLGDNNSVYDDFGTSPHTLNSDIGSAYVGPMDIHHHHPQRNNKFMNERNKIQQSSLVHYPQQQQSIYHASSGYLSNAVYPSSSSSSSSPSAGPSGFPMSAPANIGYDFHLNTRSPMNNASIGSSSTNSTSQGHMPMTLTPQLQQQSLSGLTQSLDDDYTIQVNLQAMMEKRRRRRESHNAVERRRRENINDRIHELGCLLPESMLEEITNASNNGAHSPSSNNNNNGNAGKPNKGAILRKSVDHIRLLQQEAAIYRQRVNELELILEQYNANQKK
ncbi:helix-loop-helix DNA-binding domain-containing protein [Chlamydoabsidia padenii]|nr:helix-loop-helix DNA-binding domain-containing protein [Chlamydoabsidia padenii]